MTKIKKVLSVVAAAAMAISMLVVSASAAEKEYTVKVTKAPSDWSKVAFWAWDKDGKNTVKASDGKLIATWPGYEVKKDGDSYTITFKAASVGGFMFTNGDASNTKKSTDIKTADTAKYNYFEVSIGEKAMVNDPMKTDGTKVEAYIADITKSDNVAAKPAGSETATTTAKPADTTTAASDAAAAKTESPKTGSTAAPIAMASIAALACAAVVVAKKRK